MIDKLAEEILDNLELDGDWQVGDIYYKHEVIRAMQAYHEAKMKEVTNEDIVKYAFNCYPDSYNMRVACANGIRDMRDGEIKHIEP